MEPNTPPSDSLYLTKDETNMLIVGLNFSLERHYNRYDDVMPDDLIKLVARVMDFNNKFGYCHQCRTHYVTRWSDDRHVCKEEEE